MVSISGANSAIPLVEQYNVITQSIAAAQQAIAGGAQIQFVHADAQVQGQEAALEAHIPLSAADTATVLNSLITIWTNLQNSLSSQIAAIS